MRARVCGLLSEGCLVSVSDGDKAVPARGIDVCVARGFEERVALNLRCYSSEELAWESRVDRMYRVLSECGVRADCVLREALPPYEGVWKRRQRRASRLGHSFCQQQSLGCFHDK